MKDKNCYEYIELLYNCITHFNNSKKRYKSVNFTGNDEEQYEFNDEDLGDFLKDEELDIHPLLAEMINTERAVDAINNPN